jgi:hypothetical protein
MLVVPDGMCMMMPLPAFPSLRDLSVKMSMVAMVAVAGLGGVGIGAWLESVHQTTGKNVRTPQCGFAPTNAAMVRKVLVQIVGLVWNRNPRYLFW